MGKNLFGETLVDAEFISDLLYKTLLDVQSRGQKKVKKIDILTDGYSKEYLRLDAALIENRWFQRKLRKVLDAVQLFQTE